MTLIDVASVCFVSLTIVIPTLSESDTTEIFISRAFHPLVAAEAEFGAAQNATTQATAWSFTPCRVIR
jgi:hypothetical protein